MSYILVSTTTQWDSFYKKNQTFVKNKFDTNTLKHDIQQ